MKIMKMIIKILGKYVIWFYFMNIPDYILGVQYKYFLKEP